MHESSWDVNFTAFRFHGKKPMVGYRSGAVFYIFVLDFIFLGWILYFLAGFYIFWLDFIFFGWIDRSNCISTKNACLIIVSIQQLFFSSSDTRSIFIVQKDPLLNQGDGLFF